MKVNGPGLCDLVSTGSTASEITLYPADSPEYRGRTSNSASPDTNEISLFKSVPRLKIA